MELRRTLLIIALAVTGYFLLLAWQKDYGHQTTTAATQPAAATQTAAASDVPAAPADAASAGDVPVAPAPVTAAPSAATPVAAAVARTISVKTDVLDLHIDTTGGDVVALSLPAYTKSVSSKSAYELLETSTVRTMVAKSGLIGTNGPDAQAQRPVYQSAASAYALEPGQKDLDVVLSTTTANGAEIKKIFHLERGSYLIKVSYQVTNKGSAPWNAALFGELKRDGSADPSADKHSFGMVTFLGAAWHSAEQNYNKRPFHKSTFTDGLAEKPVKESVTGGWAAMVQHYFVSAWVPDAKSTNTISSRVDKGFYYIGFISPYFSVAPGQTTTVSADLYAGPKIQDKLATISKGLELTVDYGVLWPIAQVLFKIMTTIHAWVIANWGWSIVLLTLLVKAAFYWLSAKGYRSMANMRRVMPEMTRIKEQYGDDRQKMSQAMMELYKKEKINPMGGCLPMLVQVPVFMALYWTLMESVELRHASWMWVTDLSVYDPIFVLPIAMGITMFVQQFLNPAPTDPMQAKVMRLMPVIFTAMFAFLPAGLTLYMLVNNLLSILQQWMITRQIEGAAKKA